MKCPFPIFDFRFPIERRSARPAAANRKSQDGVALVITLIMLSVITFMAITFLVLSQRETNSVNTATDTKISRMAADSALDRVIAELTTHMLVHTNFQDFDLMVSTNYINFDTANINFSATVHDPRMVNYDFAAGLGQTLPNIANLLYNPRAPVFVVTNRGNGSNEFRFYIDLNRNGRFDTNGMWPVISPFPGTPYYNATNGALEPAGFVGPILSNNFAQDPEWIGVLERPEEVHGADNKFISRYAYIVVPIARTLDVNAIHNQAFTETLNPLNDGYVRNQGMGPWEINFAAFLTDLNTNEWQIPVNPYKYRQATLGLPNQGAGFEDALGMLSYRYNNNYANLSSASVLFPGAAGFFQTDNGDQYSDGPLMLTTSEIDESVNPDPVTKPWAGADNPNHYFTMGDFYDRTKTTQAGVAIGFSDRLRWAGGSNDSYNASTFYRMLAQLGADSEPEPYKININYKNLDVNGKVVPGMETNLIPWTPIDFFTNAAQAMFNHLNLRDLNGNLITVTNIPVYEDPSVYKGTNINYYTPAVHRILQLAANLVDATTNQTVALLPGQTNAFFPSVFRPHFSSQNGVVYICGFGEEKDTTGLTFPFLELADAAKTSQLNNTTANLFGVPWVIGAKKGFPNFNEFGLENTVKMTRKLQFTQNASGDVVTTNQTYVLGISNVFGVEAWNSYSSAWPSTRPLQMTVIPDISLVLTNQLGILVGPFGPLLTNHFTGPPVSMSVSQWSGSQFKVPLLSTNIFLADSDYMEDGTFKILGLEPSDTFPIPRWNLNLVTHVRFVLVDTTARRIVDFVNLSYEDPSIEIMSTVSTPGSGVAFDHTIGSLFYTNRMGDPGNNGAVTDPRVITYGENFQIALSKNERGDDDLWKDYNEGGISDRVAKVKAFNNRLLKNIIDPLPFQAPFNPVRKIYLYHSWQANDPLVHYTVPDLTDLLGNNSGNIKFDKDDPDVLSGLGGVNGVNPHYRPWGNPRDNKETGAVKTQWNLGLKDPLVSSSDAWSFPTNKLPNVGWLGRVHRGTPWQTVYMKPPMVTANDLRMWTGDTLTYTNGNTRTPDSSFMQPTDDYRLFDLFTTGVNENASRGQLSVNQTNLAAWSAVLSGVNVVTNSVTGATGPAVIDPAGIYDPANPPALVKIWQGINDTRGNTNPTNRLVFPNGVFQNVGDVLATPQLTIASPFLNTNALNTPNAGGLSDAVVERIPQQIMSLLTLNQTPRFVIYSYGQTLHPADRSKVVGGTFNGLITNYQITAETATRAVVRVEGTPDPYYVDGRLDSFGRAYPPHIVVEQFNVLPPD